MKQNQQNHIRGSILFYILIAVALFAALSFAVARMLQGGGAADNISGERQDTTVIEILDYTNAMRQTVRNLRISNNCDEDQISFERSPFDGSDTSYVNPNAPADFSCHVFHAQGGAMRYSAPTTAMNGGAADWFITGYSEVPRVGESGKPELIVILPDISKALCLRLNDKLGVDNPSGDAPEDADSVNSTTFKGTYEMHTQIGLAAQLGGKMAACFKHTQPNPDTYNFYQVLIGR